jgi:CRP-like cAMP-binding protein
LQATQINLLQRMPIFGAIREDTLQVLLAQARQIEVAAGACLCREGELASSMFVLESGSASVLKLWQGREHLLHRLQAGDCVGEMALMDLQPRSASVRADVGCRAIEFSTDDLMRLFEHDIEQFALIQMNIGREVCRRLRATGELLFRFRMESEAPPGAPAPPPLQGGDAGGPA